MKEIQNNIKSGQFHRVYLLYGPEVYLRSRYRQMLLEALVGQGDEINFTRFSEKEADSSAIIAQAETLPFFAPRRVILAEDSGLFKNKAEEMAAYLERLPEYLVLIFSEKDVDKRTRTFKAVQKYGHIAEFAEQSEETLTRWILTRMKKDGKKITPADMRHFLEASGTDMNNIENELNKLLAYCADREVITGADIDAVCTPQITNQIFDMVRAVTEKRQERALELYYDLLSLKEQPMRILYLITRQYNQLLQIGALSRESLPPAEIASRIGIPPFAVRKSMGLVRQYPEARLRQILEELASMEEEVKTGRLNDSLSVELAIVKLSA